MDATKMNCFTIYLSRKCKAFGTFPVSPFINYVSDVPFVVDFTVSKVVQQALFIDSHIR